MKSLCVAGVLFICRKPRVIGHFVLILIPMKIDII